MKIVTDIVHMNPPLVIFDGVCTLCNHSVDVLLRTDKTGTLMFGSFQDPRIRELLVQHHINTEPTTVYLLHNNTLFSESDAILELAKFTKAPYSLLRIGVMVPRFMRDAIYRWVAKNRYRWFGKRQTCRIPTEDEKSRFF